MSGTTVGDSVVLNSHILRVANSVLCGVVVYILAALLRLYFAAQKCV